MVLVAPHKAVAEVSEKMRTYRTGGLLQCMDGKLNPLMDRKVAEAPKISDSHICVVLKRKRFFAQNFPGQNAATNSVETPFSHMKAPSK